MLLTDQREGSLQVKAYLKRMARTYECAPEPPRSEEIEALLDALRAKRGDHRA